MVMCMAASTHCFDMNHGWTASFETKFSCRCNACMPCSWVRTIDGPTWESHSSCFVSPQFNTRLMRRRCIESDLIVLKNIADWQTSSTGKVERFPIFARRRCSFTNTSNVESAKRLFPTCKGKPCHGGACDGKRSCWRKDSYVPCSDVQISSSCPFMSTVLVRIGFTHLSSHNINHSITHS